MTGGAGSIMWKKAGITSVLDKRVKFRVFRGQYGSITRKCCQIAQNMGNLMDIVVSRGYPVKNVTLITFDDLLNSVS
jgi:hypothetical protein